MFQNKIGGDFKKIHTNGSFSYHHMTYYTSEGLATVSSSLYLLQGPSYPSISDGSLFLVFLLLSPGLFCVLSKTVLPVKIDKNVKDVLHLTCKKLTGHLWTSNMNKHFRETAQEIKFVKFQNYQFYIHPV